MTTVLRLAEQLAATDDDDLTALAISSSLSPDGIDDVFDLAEALLHPDAVQRRLARLDRGRLAAIAAAASLGEAAPDGTADRATTSAVADRLRSWGATDVDTSALAAMLAEAGRLALVDVVGDAPGDTGATPGADVAFEVYGPVAERLAAWTDEGLPDGPTLAAEPAPPALAAVPDPSEEAEQATRAAAQTAFETVATVSDLLGELARTPARELAKGGVGLPERGRLAQAARRDADTVVTVLDLADDAGLVEHADGVVRPSDGATIWAEGSTAIRWTDLAASWLAAVPEPVRRVLVDRAFAGWADGLREHLSWLYPAADPRSGERLARALRDAEALGLAADGGPTALGLLVLRDGASSATDAAATLFPDEVEQVYLQHDLTVVAPGPLIPAVDARLRRLADVESRTLAATFRITAGSIGRALATGETEESLREFLASVSLTGIPQPLDYLLHERASRVGRLRLEPVTADPRGYRSFVRSDDADLLTTVAVDSVLDPLGLERVGEDVLATRSPADVVRGALDAAGYPVGGDATAPTPALRPVVSASGGRTSTRAPLADRVASMLVRVRGSVDSAGGGDAWLGRQLEAAVRTRSAVIVTVSMPDGRQVEHLVEPTGVSGGRLRARDRTADLERTVPLTSITAVRSP